MRDDIRIDWNVPKVAPGILGRIEKFFGPGKTTSESIIELATAFIVPTILYFKYHTQITNAELEPWKLGILILLTLDLLGGIITNSTNAAKRSYHQNQKSKGRLIFVSHHTIHLAVLSLLFLNFDWHFFLFNCAALTLGALAIELAQIQTKRPLAMLLFLSVVGLNSILFQLPSYLELFPALFYLKLYICFLVTEVPAYGN